MVLGQILVHSPSFSIGGQIGLGSRDDPSLRPNLLRILTDLYVQKPHHSEDEEKLFTELAMRLLDAVDAAARAAVASRLVLYPRPPLNVLRRLARDIPDVAAPVLIQTAALPLAELIEIAEEMGAEHAALVAARPEFSPLIGTRAFEPAFADEPSSGETVAMPATLSDLFFAADAQERRLILLNIDYAPLTPARIVAADDAQAMLERAALMGHAGEFARILESALELSQILTERIVQDGSGETIVVAAKALAVPPDVLHRILLFINPQIGRSVQRVYDLVALYDEISDDAALRMVAIWQEWDRADGLDRAPRPEPERRRRTSAPAPQPTANLQPANSRPDDRYRTIRSRK